ncbi:hypothetical protein [Amycolatopsis cihanbeyliensis]|uniref:Uncharacterized protein n=1 Tax=Amycolatopsis cihanbeyliensis TaxID=1128664 RepID=A0A542DET7_AMYCI|nr:hypothetical protein [Amycolatopsis cihanbeyliensis]TQJ01579.1 hypothetical protein FB471_1270 [Amycolatopsis cihanbeyliensis]
MSYGGHEEPQLSVPVTTRCSAGMILYHGRLPALVIDYGGAELILVTNEDSSLATTREFIINLISASAAMMNALTAMMHTGRHRLHEQPDDKET